jgi:beta-N-acetylglucosaminidase
MIKRINKTKVIGAILAPMVLLGGVYNVHSYNQLHSEYKETKSEVVEAYKHVETLDGQIKELEEKYKTVTTDNTELEEKVNKLGKEKEELISAEEELRNENEELKGFIEEVTHLPKWNPDNVTSPSHTSEIGLSLALKGTGLEGLESSFIEAEKAYGINALFLTSLIAQESGWGESNRAKTQNNLSGYAVYSDSAEGKTFSSKHESIMATASLLRKNYVDSDGRHSIHAINKKYSADPKWASHITTIANKLVKEVNVNNYVDVTGL